MEKATAHSKALGAIDDTLPPAAPTAVACPEDLEPLNMSYFDLRSALGRPYPGGVEQASLPSFAARDNIGSLTWQRVASWAKEDGVGTRELDALDKAKHVRVAVVTERVAPTNTVEGFHPGRVDAWLLTYELASSELVCAQHVTATNSDSVFGGATNESDKLALARDLDENLDRAVNELLRGE